MLFFQLPMDYILWYGMVSVSLRKTRFSFCRHLFNAHKFDRITEYVRTAIIIKRNVSPDSEWEDFNCSIFSSGKRKIKSLAHTGTQVVQVPICGYDVSNCNAEQLVYS